MSSGASQVRIVTHLDVSQQDIDKAALVILKIANNG